MAPSTSSSNHRASSPPPTKKARIEKMPMKSKKQKKAKAKKGPACEPCRKKHTKCAHRLELGSVTKPSSSSSSTPAEASKQEPSPAPKLDGDGRATEAVRRRIWKDRQKYTIQFSEEDWHREPVWASRVYGGWDSVDEHLLHSSESRAGN